MLPLQIDIEALRIARACDSEVMCGVIDHLRLHKHFIDINVDKGNFFAVRDTLTAALAQFEKKHKRLLSAFITNDNKWNRRKLDIIVPIRKCYSLSFHFGKYLTSSVVVDNILKFYGDIDSICQVLQQLSHSGRRFAE